ncbi:hypothetical protein [uncultured Marivita sp.]|uniref:hypothetical protein n=1 Tax=uncultured Marivita sp. TaxID=888080 RepID=UPI002630C35D|nr:hypothetical protein [uncultured Marivita sp.]
MRQSVDPDGTNAEQGRGIVSRPSGLKGSKVVKRIIGSAARALMMALLVAVPSLVLPGTSSDAAQMAALVALVAAVVTFAEYYSEYPTFLEFRNAPPFNRLRFLALFFCVWFASLLVALSTKDPALPPTFLENLAMGARSTLDFPFSPVRLMAITFAEAPGWLDVDLATEIASLLLMVTMISLLLFWIHARFIFWPIRKQAFNFWINLPLFDPTSGRDVLFRLKRDAHFNLALGFLLPFLIPALLRFWIGAFDASVLAMPEVLIWVLCAWAFLPLTLMMRGVALFRVAALIQEKRRRAYAQEDDLQLV